MQRPSDRRTKLFQRFAPFLRFLCSSAFGLKPWAITCSRFAANEWARERICRQGRCDRIRLRRPLICGVINPRYKIIPYLTGRIRPRIIQAIKLPGYDHSVPTGQQMDQTSVRKIRRSSSLPAREPLRMSGSSSLPTYQPS
jgi:hypothetical protein